MTPEPRTVSVYCGAPSHAPERPVVGMFVSHGDPERWSIADGPWCQRIAVGVAGPALDPEMPVAGSLVLRGKFVCQTCGYDVTIGDRLGAGYTTEAAKSSAWRDFTAADTRSQKAEAAAALAALAGGDSLHAALSRIADAGVSCIPVTHLAYMLRV